METYSKQLFVFKMTTLVRLSTYPSSSRGLAAAAEVSKDHHYQMCGEPNVLISHVLVDINENKYSRRENS